MGRGAEHAGQCSSTRQCERWRHRSCTSGAEKPHPLCSTTFCDRQRGNASSPAFLKMLLVDKFPSRLSQHNTCVLLYVLFSVGNCSSLCCESVTAWERFGSRGSQLGTGCWLGHTALSGGFKQESHILLHYRYQVKNHHTLLFFFLNFGLQSLTLIIYFFSKWKKKGESLKLKHLSYHCR